MGKTRDIREAVESELGHDPRVDGGGITVKNVNGEVALNGTVPSYPQYLKAEAAARGVAGVINVHNHLKVVLPPEDYLDDPLLTTAANNALAASLAVPDGVEATAENGNLTLTANQRIISFISADFRTATSAPLCRTGLAVDLGFCLG